MADLRTVIAKLNRDNYVLWKYRMELLLRKEKVWDAIEKPAPANPDAAWTKKDTDATILIGLSLEDSEVFRISQCRTAKDAWNTPKSYHEKSTLSNKVKLMRAICSLKLHADGNVEDHIVQMKMLFSKLQSLGEKMTDSWLISMLLSSLPSNYDILITALEARNENDLTLSMVEDKLLEQY